MRHVTWATATHCNTHLSQCKQCMKLQHTFQPVRKMRWQSGCVSTTPDICMEKKGGNRGDKEDKMSHLVTTLCSRWQSSPMSINIKLVSARERKREMRKKRRIGTERDTEKNSKRERGRDRQSLGDQTHWNTWQDTFEYMIGHTRTHYKHTWWDSLEYMAKQTRVHDKTH